MDLYKLLPSVIRFKDRLGSAVGSSSSEETVLQKFLYALEQDCDDTDNLIDGLSDLYHPETCPVEYLPLLENMLGSTWPGDWPESRRRLVVSAIVKLYHHSGQRLSWVSILNLLGYSGFFPWELWKSTVYENFDYSLYGGDDGYYGVYHAARVDIRNSSETLKQLTDFEQSLLETFRPIHVLIRQEGERIMSQEDIVGKSVQGSFQGEAKTIFEEQLVEGFDELSLIITCVALCEIGMEPA